MTRCGTAVVLALTLVSLAGAQATRKMTALAADLTPAFEYLTERGILHQDGLKDAYGHIEAMYRPVPSEAAASLIPWGFNNIHVPFSMRGDPVPADRRRPGLQVDARYIVLGEGAGERIVNAGVIVHEIAHGEFSYWKYRSKTGRLQRQHDLMYRLRDHLQDVAGIPKHKWPLLQANEMAAYYIETSVWEIAQRIEAVFLVERFGVRRIKSRADREALIGPDGEEILVAPMDSSTIRDLYEKPAWLVGGRKGDAFFEGEPIDAEIPEAWRQEFYRDILGLELPETGDAVIALARGLKGAWAAEQRRLLKQARDRRVANLGDEATSAGAPSVTDLAVGDGGAAGAEELQPSRDEQALLTRVASGTGWATPPVSLLRHRGATPRVTAPGAR